MPLHSETMPIHPAQHPCNLHGTCLRCLASQGHAAQLRPLWAFEPQSLLRTDITQAYQHLLSYSIGLSCLAAMPPNHQCMHTAFTTRSQ
eukprot:1162150-Pelagomonas_calceolata.AAC.5